jgi:two-component system, sporulation sensor kinase E
MNIYNNRYRFKVIVLVVSLVIGASSLLFTNFLVKQLAERELKLIMLYANGLKFLGTVDTDQNISFLFDQIINANTSVPMILTDENHEPKSEKNLRIPARLSPEERIAYLKEQIIEMREQYAPIEVEYGPGMKEYIYFKNSDLIRQLKYYPYVQLTVIFAFAFIAYLAFSYSRRAEQNRVWVGLAKETAHQLGTPLSSLVAWVEFFKTDDRFKDDNIIEELEKDLQRLDMITSRFSNIGSVPTLKDENVADVIQNGINYLQSRISNKVKIFIHSVAPEETTAKINKPLFDWVIENITKNAVDAMSGAGQIDIKIMQDGSSKVIVDITDNGKGMPKSQAGKVFEPGFTTKKRGWGLGLTLVKRIVENYHKGRIFVKHSEPGKGTTFRIILNQ